MDKFLSLCCRIGLYEQKCYLHETKWISPRQTNNAEQKKKGKPNAKFFCYNFFFMCTFIYFGSTLFRYLFQRPFSSWEVLCCSLLQIVTCIITVYGTGTSTIFPFSWTNTALQAKVSLWTLGTHANVWMIFLKKETITFIF